MNRIDESASLAEAALDLLFPSRSLRRVLLVNPPDGDAALFRYDTAKRRRYANYPPYGLAVLAQNLRQIGVEVHICNLNHELLKRCVDSKNEVNFDFEAVWQAKLTADFQAFHPELIGITCMFTMTHSSFQAVARYAAAWGVPLAIGGVHVTNDVDRILDDLPQVALAFLREGDLSLPLFVRVVRRELPASKLRQVILNEPSGRLRFPGGAVPGPEVISLVPAFDFREMSEYSQYGTVGSFYFLKPAGARLATALSNRGCRGKCTFCSVHNFNGMGVRHRSIASVLDELEKLQNEGRIQHITWLDDDLFKNHQRAISLFQGMVKRGLKLTWDATNGVIASSCTEEVIHAATESGCVALNIGMESGHVQVLRQVKKPSSVANFLRAAEVLRKYEQIHSSVFLMIGFPGETMAMILETLRVARQMDLDWYRISQLQPLPNTPIYQAMVAQGLAPALGSKELRFMGGAFGKQTEMEQGLALASPDFRKAFASIPLEAVPTPEQLTDIWFYLNYHLNFHRLFHEDRPVKIQQQIRNLRCLSDVISPENGFALYLLGVLQNRYGRGIEPGLIERLQKRLSTSAYWQDRFEAFGLSVGDFRGGQFERQEDPLLQPAAWQGSMVR